MINRRQLLTWWCRPADPAPVLRRDPAPPLTRIVGPTPTDAPEPFSLESFYAARAKERER